jgi:eukaryotic-like serine/threonine-protein kinase
MTLQPDPSEPRRLIGNNMNAELATNILDNLVREKRGKSLNGLQRAIIQGVLDGLTYQEIKHNYAIARNYEICYLARYVAYHLWKLLTEVLKDAGIIDPDEKVRNKNLWESAMRVAQQSVQSESVQKNQPPVPPADTMQDEKLRMRYRITEHLINTEFSDTYLAEDEDMPDRPLRIGNKLRLHGSCQGDFSRSFKEKLVSVTLSIWQRCDN